MKISLVLFLIFIFSSCQDEMATYKGDDKGEESYESDKTENIDVFNDESENPNTTIIAPVFLNQQETTAGNRETYNVTLCDVSRSSDFFVWGEIKSVEFVTDPFLMYSYSLGFVDYEEGTACNKISPALRIKISSPILISTQEIENITTYPSEIEFYLSGEVTIEMMPKPIPDFDGNGFLRSSTPIWWTHEVCNSCGLVNGQKIGFFANYNKDYKVFYFGFNKFFLSEDLSVLDENEILYLNEISRMGNPLEIEEKIVSCFDFQSKYTEITRRENNIESIFKRNSLPRCVLENQ